jgi:hypothetical protein
MPRLQCAGPRGCIDQMGEVSRLILLGVGGMGRTGARATGGSASGSAGQEAVAGSDALLAIVLASTSGGNVLKGSSSDAFRFQKRRIKRFFS